MARPPYKPTAAQRRQVSIAAGGGMSHEAIALVLGLARNTLEKHFAEELLGGAYQRRYEALQGVYAAAKRGNVSAAKTYLAGAPQSGRSMAEAEPRAPMAAAVGKKEAANALARSAQRGTEWADLLPSQSAVQ